MRQVVAFAAEAALDIARIRSQSLRLYGQVRATLRNVEAFPQIAPPWLNGTHRATVATHSVVYRVHTEFTEVLAVLPSWADDMLRRRTLKTSDDT